MVLQREGPSHIIKEKRGPDDPELLESLEEALSQVGPEALVQVADELAARENRFQALLQRTAAGGPEGSFDELTWLARSLTHSRDKAATLTAFLTSRPLNGLWAGLLDEAQPAPLRLAAFVRQLDDSQLSTVNSVDVRLRLELGAGLLHYTHPGEHWLWTRWMWDVCTETGILPLLAGSAAPLGSVRNLLGDDIAAGYVNVGSVMAMSMRLAKGTGLLTPELVEDKRRARYAADVFLACAYSIYLYGITSWRLSREYNRLLPTLPNLMRKLLGLPKVNA